MYNNARTYSRNQIVDSNKGVILPNLIPNIENRVRKLPKPANATQALQPLFEAVSNAFYAIEDRSLENVKIAGLVNIDITNLSDPEKFKVEISDNEPPRVYRRLKLSKDGPYDTEKIHPELHG